MPRGIRLGFLVKPKIWAVFALVSAALGAQDLPQPSPGPAAPLPFQTALYVWGISGAVGFHPAALVPGQETTFWAGAMTMWSWANYWRDPVTGQIPATPSPSQALVTIPEVTWQLGIDQGLVRQTGNPVTGTWEDPSLVRAVFYYKGSDQVVEASGSYLADSALPDKTGLVENSLLGGLVLDSLTKVDAHGLKSGYYTEATWQQAPRAVQSVAVDFSRANVTAMGFWPLYDAAPTSRANVLSLLAADFLAVDRLWGNQIPFLEAQSMGGLRGIEYYGAGNNLVRGVETGRFDGNFKAMNSFDLRLNLPAFPVLDQALPKLVPAYPGLVAYFDSGYYAQVPGEEPGFLFSTGIGLFVNFWNLGSLGLAKDFWLNGTDFNPPLFRIIFGMQF